MSFLSSILSTIGEPSQAPSSPATRSPAPTVGLAKPPAPKLAAGNGTTPGQAVKRKAEGDAGVLPAKAPKRDDQGKLSDKPNGTARPATVSTTAKVQSASTNASTYRGTVKDGGTLANPRVVPKPISIAKPPSVVQQATKPAKPTTPTSAGAPKKGSYQEILARAKAQQAQQSQVGVIKHKKVENLPKRDRLAQQAEAKKNNSTASKQGGKLRPSEDAAKPGDAPKEKKKATDLGYRGTVRPAVEPAYKGTMRSGAAAKGSGSSGSKPQGYRGSATMSGAKDKGRMAGYASYSDEEEEEDYDESDMSDMEAAAFDVEEEEIYSLRAAKKEDEEALQEEEDLKRKKEQRRKMLAKMAAENAKKRRF